MKYIFLNLKRFDMPPEFGGVNRIAPLERWAVAIIEQTEDSLRQFDPEQATFVQFYPEAHLLAAIAAIQDKSPIQVGCQGVFREDTAVGGNFGAFTTNRPASFVRAAGAEWALIGHSEERRDKSEILAEAGITDASAVNRLLQREIAAAINAGLKVVYCIGEKADEQDKWQDVLFKQLIEGLHDIDHRQIVIAYEPIWAIGPGKVPPDSQYITKIARFIKDNTRGLPIVYGGGLKEDNAAMLASIPEIDGGLIALTRFSGEIGFYPDEYLKIINRYMASLTTGGKQA